MAIVINIDVMLARRKMASGELAEKIGISPANMSILKTGKAKGPGLPARRFTGISGGAGLEDFIELRKC